MPIRRFKEKNVKAKEKIALRNTLIFGEASGYKGGKVSKSSKEDKEKSKGSKEKTTGNKGPRAEQGESKTMNKKMKSADYPHPTAAQSKEARLKQRALINRKRLENG